MTNVNQRIFDRIVDHMGDVRLYEEGVQVQTRRIIARHRKRLRDLLRGDIRSDLVREVRRFNTEFASHIETSMREFSTSQLDFHTDNIHKEVNRFYKTRRPRSRELLAEIAGPNIRGDKNLTRNLRNISSGELVRIQTRVRSGLARGATPNAIIDDVLKTTRITEHQARTLTRTSITSTTSAALDQVMRENSDIVSGYMFTAILDSRTSPICQHHNGKVYDVDETQYRPPLHWNCRSTMVPVIKNKDDIIATESERLKRSPSYNRTVFGEEHNLQNVRQVEARIKAYDPKFVYHEFYEEPETIRWARRNGYKLRPGDLSYVEKARIREQSGELAMHRAREAFMRQQIENSDPSVRNAFVMGNDHAFDRLSVVAQMQNIRRYHHDGRLFDSRTDIDPAQVNGQPAARESFSQWLIRQAMEIQLKILGTMERVNLFRRGTLKVEEFTNSGGVAISLQVLRRRAATATNIYRPRQVDRDTTIRVNAATPQALIRNKEHADNLRAYIVSESDNFNSTLSLTDYRGTSLVGKQAARRRSANEFDERNFIADTFTGEVRSTLRYSPDTVLYQERIDFMKRSKDLTQDQKEFIEAFVTTLDDRISVNQQTAVIETLRVLFQRANADKQRWDSLTNVFSAETRFAVQNVSRLLDTRSRQRSQIIGGFLSTDEAPKVQILGKYYSVDDIIKQQLADSRFVNGWRAKQGARLARQIYFGGRAPLSSYTQAIIRRYPSKEDFVEGLLNRVIPFRKKYLAFVKRFNRPPSDSWITKTIRSLRESYRFILDLEWAYIRKKPSSRLMDNKVTEALAKAAEMVASGRSTDYDSLAINIGKMLHEDLGDLFPFTANTLKDYHTQGSRILEGMREQGLIRVSFLGKTRRGVYDVDTGRASGGWGETISREVTVIDKTLLKLQEANARMVIARRYGVVSDRDRLYVRAGHKTFFDARGNDTGIPIISADKFRDYDANQIDREMAKMMNHVMNVEYEVDSTFVSFMDDLARFRDPRGKSKYYDSINEFRHEIINRGEAGYGLMSAARFHNQRRRPFRTEVFIDSRGRVYHRGYLTPTGGELVRPFLNSHKRASMTRDALDELRIQIGALIGPGTEALTQAGRRAIFSRNEARIRELGELLLATTQRDRRIREFLEHPLISGLEGAEVAKLARMALEYARIHRHVDGNFEDIKKLATYRTQLMIENDASSSGAQIIALSTRDRPIAQASNVVATSQKNRLYDLVAMDTVNDPDFLKIAALRDANLTWEDLAKGAKAQNMVTFYGAGDATRAANVANKLSSILDKKGFVAITKSDLNDQLRIVDGRIKVAERLNATHVVDDLQNYRRELIQAVNGNSPISRQLLTQARDIHPDSEAFVLRMYNGRDALIGPNVFQEISRIMSKNLSARAPVTDNFINFWKRVARDFVRETQEVDIPWVTFDGKIMMQRYRGKSQERIEFTDPITGRRVSNIYEGTVEDGNLRGNHAFADASIGLGVNGNHSNDAVIVRRFHLWGLQNGIPTATIHDAFFTNIGDADRARTALRSIYADALEGDTIRRTLREMRRRGLSRRTYNELLAEARRRGLIDPPNALTREDILAPIPDGFDWYGIGP